MVKVEMKSSTRRKKRDAAQNLAVALSRLLQYIKKYYNYESLRQRWFIQTKNPYSKLTMAYLLIIF